MAYKIIPLTTNPNQTFISTLPIDNKNIELKFYIRYNTEAEYWTMSITDVSTQTLLIDSLPLLTGFNLLEQYDYMGIGKAFIIKSGSPNTENPDDTNLGTDFLLGWCGNNE